MAAIDLNDLGSVLGILRDVAHSAGDDIAMRSFREGGQTTAQVTAKLGGSPVTEADLAVNQFLHERLTALFPSAGWLSEETADSPDRLGKRDVLVVDPIDGTRAFVSGLTSWAVSVALVSGHRPVAGVVYVPALKRLYQAARGRGATCNGTPLRVAARTELPGATIVGPQNFVGAYAARAQMTYVEKVPSIACRFVRVAEGEFDAGMSSSNAHDWDLAGADLILEEAGGRLSAADARPLSYNQPVPRHPALVGTSQALHPALVQLLGQSPRPRG